MLKPPTATVVEEIPDAEINKCSSWLESFAARSSHSSMISSTSMEAVYNFLQKCILFLRASAARDTLIEDVSRLDELLQRANSTVLEAQLMSHDAGVTFTELYTHLHMLRRRTVLKAPSIELPKCDKDRLMVMSLGGHDLFGPNARHVHEWCKDTEEEQVKMISRVFDERQQCDKAAHKKSSTSSSSSRPPRSMAHKSPLDSLHPHRPQDSYQRPPGQPFRRDQGKQSSNKAHHSSSNRGQPYNKDKKSTSQQSHNSGNTQSSGQNLNRRDEDKPSQQGRSSFKKGRGGGNSNHKNRTGLLPVWGKLCRYQARWSELFPQFPEIVRKISQGIFISFFDEAPSLLYQPLELPSNHKPSDYLLALNKLLNSQAIEEVMDPSSPGFYSRLFLVPKPDGTFRPIIDLKRLNLYLDIPSFKMETLFSILTALQTQEWITKIDLKDAYHHIPIHINIRKYFHFVIAEKPYQFRVLPFGLSTAPQEFTKTLAPVVQLLRSQGIRVHAYMDDWIIRADSPDQSA